MPPSSSRPRDRFIHSVESILEAAKELPEAAEWRSDSFQVVVEGNRSIEFRRVKFKDASGRGYRWIFDGKMLVR